MAVAVALVTSTVGGVSAAPVDAVDEVDTGADLVEPDIDGVIGDVVASRPSPEAAVVEAATGPTMGDVVSLVPARLVETRSGPGDVTTDGEFEGVGRVGAGQVFEFGVLDRGGAPGSKK
ncbi:MAG: hypothetical protein KDB37_14540 [Ilumatobacter sp.]|nr:hypothetical protein [Ilumatobacter sp.]